MSDLPEKPDPRLIKIPEPHRETFDAIEREVQKVHMLWTTFKALFKDESTLKVINGTASTWGWLTQVTFADAIALSLSRLSDPPQQGKFTNLVLESLRPLATESNNEDLLIQFDTVLAKLKTGLEVIREHRNRRIAHSDDSVTRRTERLPDYTVETVDNALEAVRELMNAFHLHFRDSQVVYEHSIIPGGADILMDLVKAGLRLRAIQRDSHDLNFEQLYKRVEDYAPLRDSELK